jgi:hypothetical protein
MPYLAVRRVRGAAWNASLPMRAQTKWAEHAAFMNALAAEGFVVLINAADGAAVRARLAADPWSGSGLLEIKSVEPWTILLDSRST